MKKDLKRNVGFRRLLENYRKIFRIPENLNYYSAEDFKSAEKMFVKIALIEGKLKF
ncbi:MAG: hypothetical protein JW786_11110 [Desulfobacterales bacterium]|nr:hypothetical protein [Desulfobacterales bacterium]